MDRFPPPFPSFPPTFPPNQKLLGPTPEERLGQFTFLVQTFGAHAVSPRFDPIVHYRNIVGGSLDAEICEDVDNYIHDHGCVSFCCFSFMNFCRLSWMLVFFVVGSGSGVVRTCHGQHQGFRGERLFVPGPIRCCRYPPEV